MRTLTLHPVASKTDSVGGVCGRLVSLFRCLQYLATIGQQSEHLKKARADDPERLEVPKEAEKEDRLNFDINRFNLSLTSPSCVPSELSGTNLKPKALRQ